MHAHFHATIDTDRNWIRFPPVFHLFHTNKIRKKKTIQIEKNSFDLQSFSTII